MQQSHSKNKSYIFAITAIIIWGTLSPVSKILLGELDAMFVLAFSSTMAAIVLFIYNAIRGNLKKFRQCSIKDVLIMAVLGFIGFFLYNWFYLCGINLLPTQQATIINYMWPAMIIVFSCIILKEKVTVSKVTAIVLAIAGVVIVAVNGDISRFLGGSINGVIFCLLAAVSYGLYSVLNKKQTYDKELGMMVFFITTAVISGICTLVNGSIPHLNPGITLGLLYNGVVINAIGYTIWTLALQDGNTAVISNMAYLTPFISLIFAKILLNEYISLYSIVGLLFIILGIVVQALGERKEQQNETSTV